MHRPARFSRWRRRPTAEWTAHARPRWGEGLSRGALAAGRALAAPLGAVARVYRRWRDAQRLYASLGSLDDHLLRDLGVHRDQIPLAAAGKLPRSTENEWDPEATTVTNVDVARKRRAAAASAAAEAPAGVAA